MKQIKSLILLLICITFVRCSLEEDFTKERTKITIQDIKMKHITYKEFNRKTQFVKNKPNIGTMVSQNIHARTTADSSYYTIYTDKITEISKDNYTSYTMLLKTPDTTKNVYYNIVFEVRNETITVFIVKYTKSDNGLLKETITTFRYTSGDTSRGPNEFQQYIEDFEEMLNNNLTNTASGGGGASWTGLGGSPIYPYNCDGIITTTYVVESHKCSENVHYTWSSGNSTCNATIPAYDELVPYFTCEPNTSGGSNNPTNGGGVNTGGGTTPPEDDSMTGMIKPEECDGQLTGDLNGDCMLSTYEMCILNGYTSEVCECLEQGGSTENCINDINCIKLLELLDTNKQNLNFYINDLVVKHQQSIKNEVSYSFSKIPRYDPDTDDYTAFNYGAVYKVGGPLSVNINLGRFWYSSIHLHPKDQEEASGIFSWLDIKTLADAYNEVTPDLKSEFSMMIVAPDPLNLNNHNVYALKVKDIRLLSQAIANEWSSSKWDGITDEQERLKAIQKALGKDYVNNKNNLAQFFLQKFSNYGISLFQLQNNQWKELVLNNTTNELEEKPCNN